MSKQKYYYYIGVITPTGTRFVTSINNATRSARWEADKKPLPCAKSVADDIVFGLCMNFTLAFTACFQFPIEAQPENCFTKVEVEA